MPSPAESAVTAFFFACRSARYRRVVPGEDGVQAAMLARMQREEELRRLDEAADRAAWEAGFD